MMIDSDKAKKIRSIVREKSIRKSAQDLRRESFQPSDTFSSVESENSISSAHKSTKSLDRTHSIGEISKMILDDLQINLTRQPSDSKLTVSKLSGPTLGNINAKLQIIRESRNEMSNYSPALSHIADVNPLSNPIDRNLSFTYSVGNNGRMIEDGNDILPPSPSTLDVRVESLPITISKATDRNKEILDKHQVN